MEIIAHRGASGDYPENTLLAFEQAILQSCDGIELDVHYHPSGEFLVSHDAIIATEQHKNIRLDQIPSTDLSQEAQTTGKLLTLKQVLTHIHGRCVVNIEVKTTFIELNKLSTLVYALQDELNLAIKTAKFSLPQFVISSFNHHVLYQIKQLNRQINTAALIASTPIDLANFCKKLNVQNLNIAFDCLNTAIVESAHQHNMQLYVYTVNKIEQLQFCYQLNVDGIFTDFPKNSRDLLTTLNNK